MSNTAEAEKFIKRIDDEYGTSWSESTNELSHFMTEFSNQQSSSKDARIKELEEQNKRYRDALTTRNDRIKFLEGKKDVPCYQLKKSIEELKARLEKAENKLEKAAGYVLDSGNRIFFAELESFLINKTE